MSYILINAELFKQLLSERSSNTCDEFKTEFSDNDYWIFGKEVCQILNISPSILNAYRENKLLPCYRFQGRDKYKRAEVYALKTRLDTELVECGIALPIDNIVNYEEDLIQTREK